MIRNRKSGLFCSALTVIGMLLIAACASPTPPDETLALRVCKEPRPEVCTREYRPVCAVLTDKSRVTAATGCTACAREDVEGYFDGPCGGSEH